MAEKISVPGFSSLDTLIELRRNTSVFSFYASHPNGGSEEVAPRVAMPLSDPVVNDSRCDGPCGAAGSPDRVRIRF